MTTLIKRLSEDHRNIARLLELLKAQVESLQTGEFTDFSLVTDIMHYFAHYPDRHHHPCEDVIFEVLAKKDASAKYAVDRILDEHGKMQRASNKLYDEFKQLQGNAIFSREKLVNGLNDYIAKYYQHMNKEEGELLPLAEKSFTESDWTAISKKISIQPDPLFGKTLDKEYETLYRSIMAMAA